MATPTESLDVRYSDEKAKTVPWSSTLERLTEAEVAWIVTVRPDGRPHATPMVPVAHDGKVCFHTGRNEVKYRNIRANPRVLVLTGDTAWQQGLDVMFEGTASEVTDQDSLRAIAALYRGRWDGRWRLDVDAGATTSRGSPDVEIVVLQVTPTRARAHDKGDPFGQTTYDFVAVDNRPQEGSS